MTRLTDTTYLATHRELRSAWLEDPTWFALLSAGEQWALHGYFIPEHNLSDDQLLVYRREVTKVDPSLPQRAGSADAVTHEGSTAGGVSKTLAQSRTWNEAQPGLRRDRVLASASGDRPTKDHSRRDGRVRRSSGSDKWEATPSTRMTKRYAALLP